MENPCSILFPPYEGVAYKRLTETSRHDLGLDALCRALTGDEKEQNFIMDVLSRMTPDVRVADYRRKVFEDIFRLPDLREQILALFDQIEFIRNFSATHIASDEKLGFWRLMHRLDELADYIRCVEAMRDCLVSDKIESEGLQSVKRHFDALYEDSCFAEMKRDIAELKEKASDIQSVTLGINVNDRFEAVGMGLVSVNTKPFKKSNIVGRFADAIASKDGLHDGVEWDGSLRYHQVDRRHTESTTVLDRVGRHMATSHAGRDGATVVNIPEGDGGGAATSYLDTTVNKLLDSIVKKLGDTLAKYASVAVVDISQILPEFLYYIRFAEFVGKSMEKGFVFCEAEPLDAGGVSMDARGLYNLKLAMSLSDVGALVYNDLRFDGDHTVYILTGANRGGKTTVTQAVGLLFALAQGGIFVPASSFSYRPVDCVYTHFPADEDQTMDLGRLGEECVRFKEMYADCTERSLLLLNETFSTTSFEEGYYIARDSVRAILKKRVRTIYNTHMHKLAADVGEMNRESDGARASSLIMKSDGGKRSFKLEIASPEGLSYARDIAEKYGVTYEALTGDGRTE